MTSQTLSSMELSCVSCSRSFSQLPSSSSAVTSLGFLVREVKGKASIARCSSRVRASAERSTEDSRGSENRRRSSFAGGIEVSAASASSSSSTSSTTMIDRSFTGDAAAELAVWEKLGAVVRLSYGIGEMRSICFQSS